MDAPGRPLEAETGLSETEVLKFGGASCEKPGISEGFHGLDFTVGEVPRDGGFFVDVGADFVTEEDDDVGPDLVIKEEDDDLGTGLVTEEDDLTREADGIDILDGADGRRVGVADLDVDFDAGADGLAVGVDGLAADLDKGVEDLEGTVDLVEGKAGREEGVEDLEGLDDAINVDRPVGVAGLDPKPPDDDGLRVPALEEFNPGEEAGCLDGLSTGPGCGFANLDFSAVGRALGVSI